MILTATQSESYTRYCNFFNHLNFLKRLGIFFRSKKLSQISKFLKERHNLLPNEVMTASVATFILFVVPLVVILFRMNTVLGIIIPLLLSYLAAYKVFNYPIAEYKRIQHTLLQYSDLAFQDLLLILNTTDSIFDAIAFISKARYPVLSEKFEDIVFQIIRYGKSPESLLQEFVDELPEGNLKERLINLIATKFHPNKLLDQLEMLAGEKKFEYKTATDQLESKLLILLVFCLFIPMLVALFVSFLGHMANYAGFIMIPIYILLTYNLKSRLLKGHFELFGESSILEEGELDSSVSNLIEFLNLLTYFGNQLKRGLPQEIALLEAFRSYQGPLKNQIEKCLENIFYWSNSFKTGWNGLKTTLDDSQINFLIDLINRMLDKSSVEAGNRVISILQQLKTNRELIREREAVVKAQHFKIKFISFVMAAILGLMAGITPLLIHMGTLLSNPGDPIDFNSWDTLPLSLSLLIMVCYAAYFLPKIVKIRHSWRLSLWTGLTFVIFWYLSSTFI